MNPDQAQALVARCLTDPDLLVGLSLAEPAQTELTADQCKRLRQVQAFIVKVKHNALRGTLRCTLRLLSDAGLELQFFMRFAAVYAAARQAGPLALPAHLQLLVPALAAFLAEGDTPERALIADVLDHERLLYELSTSANGWVAGSLVAWRGRCIVVHRRFEVTSLAQALEHGRCAPESLQHSHYLLYQASDDGKRLRLRELDALTVLLLQHLSCASDWPSAVQQLSATLGRSVTGEEIRAFVQDAVDADILASTTTMAVEGS